MNGRVRTTTSVLLAAALVGCNGEPVPPDALDVLILGGTVVDGTGDPAVEADVGIRNGQVVFVGDGEGEVARDTVDAEGMVVSPGFVDVHSHTAAAIAEADQRWNEGKVRQGVTTVMGGPDGGFATPFIRELIDVYEEQGVGTNVAFYVGHGGVRSAVMGDDYRREATPDEIQEMRDMVREGMELGAVGLSSGLMYEPGMFATTDEVVALAEEVEPFDGIYTSHTRDPVHAWLESQAEAIEIGERAGIPVKSTHIKPVGLQNRSSVPELFELFDEARDRGVEVVSDQYPYDGAATGTLERIIIVPEELEEEEDFDLEAALRDPNLNEEIRRVSEEGIDGGFAWLDATGYSAMRIVSSPDFPDLVGQYLIEIAEDRGVRGWDVVTDLYLEAEEPVFLTLGGIDEEDVRTIMVQPWNMIASDGGYVDSETTQPTHRRATGTFPRVLGHYVRDEGVLELEEAVYKMTWFPARFVGLHERGRLMQGMAADVAVFDPGRIIDRSTWDEPLLMPEGVLHVLVDGTFVLRDEELTGEAPGRFLPKNRIEPGPEVAADSEGGF